MHDASLLAGHDLWGVNAANSTMVNQGPTRTLGYTLNPPMFLELYVFLLPPGCMFSRACVVSKFNSSSSIGGA